MHPSQQTLWDTNIKEELTQTYRIITSKPAINAPSQNYALSSLNLYDPYFTDKLMMISTDPKLKRMTTSQLLQFIYPKAHDLSHGPLYHLSADAAIHQVDLLLHFQYPDLTNDQIDEDDEDDDHLFRLIQSYDNSRYTTSSSTKPLHTHPPTINCTQDAITFATQMMTPSTHESSALAALPATAYPLSIPQLFTWLNSHHRLAPELEQLASSPSPLSHALLETLCSLVPPTAPTIHPQLIENTRLPPHLSTFVRADYELLLREDALLHYVNEQLRVTHGPNAITFPSLHLLPPTLDRARENLFTPDYSTIFSPEQFMPSTELSCVRLLSVWLHYLLVGDTAIGDMNSAIIFVTFILKLFDALFESVLLYPVEHFHYSAYRTFLYRMMEEKYRIYTPNDVGSVDGADGNTFRSQSEQRVVIFNKYLMNVMDFNDAHFKEMYDNLQNTNIPTELSTLLQRYSGEKDYTEEIDEDVSSSPAMNLTQLHEYERILQTAMMTCHTTSLPPSQAEKEHSHVLHPNPYIFYPSEHYGLYHLLRLLYILPKIIPLLNTAPLDQDVTKHQQISIDMNRTLTTQLLSLLTWLDHQVDLLALVQASREEQSRRIRVAYVQYQLTATQLLYVDKTDDISPHNFVKNISSTSPRENKVIMQDLHHQRVIKDYLSFYQVYMEKKRQLAKDSPQQSKSPCHQTSVTPVKKLPPAGAINMISDSDVEDEMEVQTTTTVTTRTSSPQPRSSSLTPAPTLMLASATTNIEPNTISDVFVGDHIDQELLSTDPLHFQLFYLKHLKYHGDRMRLKHYAMHELMESIRIIAPINTDLNIGKFITNMINKQSEDKPQ